MASSSVSQEDFDHDIEISNRRSRVRTCRARAINAARDVDLENGGTNQTSWTTSNTLPCHSNDTAAVVGSAYSAVSGSYTGEHDSPKPPLRAKDKRVRCNHLNKGKQQRVDRRKLREKRRSAGVVHIPSTESTGGSTGEDEDGILGDVKKNTILNELPCSKDTVQDVLKNYSSRGTKSPSDLDADDEDNQDYDSTFNQSDSAISLTQEVPPLQQEVTSAAPQHDRPETPSTENTEELLERAQTENKRLLELLKDKDRKISALERQLSLLTRDLQLTEREKEKLKEENSSLIKSMSSK